MKNNKLILVLTGVVGVVVMIVGLLGYFGFRFTKKSEPTTQKSISTTTSKDETANWKTYTNSQYGFEFKYPTGWFELVSSDGPWSFQSKSFSENIQSLDIPKDGMWISIVKRSSCGEYTGGNYEEVIREGYGSILEKIECKNNFEINLGLWKNGKSDQEKETLDQIISTFKFTK